MNLQTGFLLSAATCTALSAGLLFAYSCSVNPGLRLLPDHDYLAAMQSINRAIQNPLFFAAFFGALILLPVSCRQCYGAPLSGRFGLLLAASVVYAVGVTGVTLLGNVPLNNALEAFSLRGAASDEMARQRLAFEGPWNRLHAVRMVASVTSLVLALLACLRSSAE